MSVYSETWEGGTGKTLGTRIRIDGVAVLQWPGDAAEWIAQEFCHAAMRHPLPADAGPGAADRARARRTNPALWARYEGPNAGGDVEGLERAADVCARDLLKRAGFGGRTTRHGAGLPEEA